MTAQLRTRICELKLQGQAYTQLSARFLDVLIGTLKTIVRSEKVRKDNVSKPRLGARKKLIEEDRLKIIARIDDHTHIKYQDLLEEIELKVHRRSIQRLLHVEGIRKWRQREGPYIKLKHAEKRIAQALRYQGKPLVVDICEMVR